MSQAFIELKIAADLELAAFADEIRAQREQ